MDEKTFTFEMYQHYLKRVEGEWPYFWMIQDRYQYTGSKRSVAFPVLIRECMRLIPIRNETTGFYEFYVRNMSLRIKQWQIIGRILSCKRERDYFDLEVCDGTGVLQVLMKNKTEKEQDQQVDAIDPPVVMSTDQKEDRDNAKGSNPTNEDTDREELDRFKKIAESLKIGEYISVSGFLGLRSATGKLDGTLHFEEEIEKLEADMRIEAYESDDEIQIVAVESQEKKQNEANKSGQTEADKRKSETQPNAQTVSKDENDTEPEALWGKNKMPRIFLYSYNVKILNEDEYLDNFTTFMEGLFKQKYTMTG